MCIIACETAYASAVTAAVATELQEMNANIDANTDVNHFEFNRFIVQEGRLTEAFRFETQPDGTAIMKSWEGKSASFNSGGACAVHRLYVPCRSGAGVCGRRRAVRGLQSGWTLEYDVVPIQRAASGYNGLRHHQRKTDLSIFRGECVVPVRSRSQLLPLQL